MDAPDLPFSTPLDLIPRGRFLLTAACGDQRRGVLVRWVQRCGGDPPMLLLALPKGQVLSPLIRDSRHFVLAAVREDDRLLARLFGAGASSEHDPFLGLPLRLSSGGAPIVERAAWFAECEMVRHLDFDTDCELYFGLVRHASPIEAAPTPRRGAGTAAATSRRRGDPDSERPPIGETARTATRRSRTPKAE